MKNLPSFFSAGLLTAVTILGLNKEIHCATTASSLPKRWQLRSPFSGDYDTFTDLKKAVDDSFSQQDHVWIVGRKGEVVNADAEFGTTGTLISNWREVTIEGEPVATKNEEPFTIDCSTMSADVPFLQFKTATSEPSQRESGPASMDVETILFRGVKIANSLAPLRVKNARLTLEDCEFSGKVAGQESAVEVTVESSNPFRTTRRWDYWSSPGLFAHGTTFSNRDAGEGSAVVVNSKSPFTRAEFRGCVFSHLRGGDGAAIRVVSTRPGSLSVDDTRFENNESSGKGGAVALYPKVDDSGEVASDSDATFDCRGCSFSGNVAQGMGGAVYVAGGRSSSVVLMNSTVEGNRVGGNDSAYTGDYESGAIYAKIADLHVENVHFAGNSPVANTQWTNAWIGGGAISAEMNGYNSRVVIVNSTVSNNVGGRAAVLLRTSDDERSKTNSVKVEGNKFYNNLPSTAGGSGSGWLDCRDMAFVPTTLQPPTRLEGSLLLQDNLHFSRDRDDTTSPPTNLKLPFIYFAESYNRRWVNVFFDNSHDCTDSASNSQFVISQQLWVSVDGEQRLQPFFYPRTFVGCQPYDVSRTAGRMGP